MNSNNLCAEWIQRTWEKIIGYDVLPSSSTYDETEDYSMGSEHISI